MKRIFEIENWGLSIVDLIKKGNPIEDSRVELKSSWIEPEKAARRIAGHANASRGEPVLWLIGIDEKSGVVGVNSLEYQNWYSEVISYFDGIYPDIIDITLNDSGKIIVCLYILTDRIPFVVKNPVFGNQGGGPISLEVPWREGTMVKTASRNQLIQILSPLQLEPDIELLNGYFEVRKYDEEFGFYIHLDLYFDVKVNHPVQIPFHRCNVAVNVGDSKSSMKLNNIKIAPPYRHLGGNMGFKSTSVTIESTPYEVIMDGSGRVILTADYRRKQNIEKILENIDISIELLPIDLIKPILLKFSFRKGTPREKSEYTYYFEK